MWVKVWKGREGGEEEGQKKRESCFNNLTYMVVNCERVYIDYSLKDNI